MKTILIASAFIVSASAAMANPNSACDQGNAAFCSITGPAGPQGPAGANGTDGGFSGIINAPEGIRPDAIGNGTPEQGVVRLRDERGDTFHVVSQDTMFKRADGGTASVNAGDRVSNAHEAELRNRQATVDYVLGQLPEVRDGRDGADGRDGIDGQHGIDGRDGHDGADGRDGTNGRDGVDGVNGRDGTSGADGQDGRDGADGLNGVDGRDGANGRDGTSGSDGINGTDGRDGTNGRDGRDFDAAHHAAALASSTAIAGLQYQSLTAGQTGWAAGIGGQFDGDVSIAIGINHGLTSNISINASIASTFDGNGVSAFIGASGRF